MAEDQAGVNPARELPEPEAPPYPPGDAPEAPAFEAPDGVGWDLPVPAAIPEAEMRCEICGRDTHTTDEHPG